MDLPGAKQSCFPGASKIKLGARFEDMIRRLTRRPYPADRLFGTALNQAELFDNLLTKVGGDRATVERLIAFGQQLFPRFSLARGFLMKR